ncbi:MAG TPA: hypothetical protein VIJ68_02815 [Candidatus Saccharimonadales bacterium]
MAELSHGFNTDPASPPRLMRLSPDAYADLKQAVFADAPAEGWHAALMEVLVFEPHEAAKATAVASLLKGLPNPAMTRHGIDQNRVINFDLVKPFVQRMQDGQGAVKWCVGFADDGAHNGERIAGISQRMIASANESLEAVGSPLRLPSPGSPSM